VESICCVGNRSYLGHFIQSLESKKMSIKEAIPTAARVVSFWTLFAMFLTGAVIMNFFIWAPQAITGRAAKYSKAMGPLIADTPPYSWLGFSVEQLMMLGTMVDIAGIFGLFNWPKLSASIVFVMTAWRQMFLRLNMNNPNIPNHPLCGFMSPHCMAVDLVHFGILIAGVFVFTSAMPMPETTVLLFKQLGLNTRWLDRGLSKYREYMPLSMRPTPLAQTVTAPVTGTTHGQTEGVSVGAGTKKNL
jgi:surface polysaccharide O-acyltransferase-like enzyme